MRDNFDRYQQAGIAIVAINPASAEAHGRYAEKFGFPFLLLSDADKAVARAFGALKESGGIQRSVFGVVDGAICFAQQGMPSSDQILEALGSH